MTPRNTVIIITYNQENLIGRALESVLCQKEFVNEIIISDDCSTDNTWTVINTYKENFPDLLKPYRNPKNLGIFANIELTWSYASGDMIYLLAGDDEFCENLFFIANKTIQDKRIDFLNNPITLYFDYKSIKPNGKEKVVKNNLILKFNPVSLKIRKLISNRTTGISRKVLEKFYSVDEIGIFTDGLLDIQTQLFSEQNYYIPYVGSIYYKNIGIGSYTKKMAALKSFLLLINRYYKIQESWSVDDLNWLKYLEIRTQFLITPNLKKYYELLCLYYRIKLFKYSLKYFLHETMFLIILFFVIFKFRR